MSKTTGRNEPCPCGSGKKFKRCHGALTAVLPSTQNSETLMKQAVARAEAKRIEIERQHGMGRPPIALQHMGHQFVAVGPELYRSKTWKTFPDFLMYYFKRCVGEAWWKEQVARVPEMRHPLYHWYVLTCEHQKRMIPKPGEVTNYTMTGAVLGVMWFTYGLYLLRHNVEIQRRLLQRLLSDDDVLIYGALYEVYVAATMIWCGFTLRLEDEGDGSTTHCEFTATSKRTSKSYSVEAKVCGPGNQVDDGRSDRAVRRQLARALRKKANHPRIVFIDLNTYLPPKGADPAEWLKSRAKALRRQERSLRNAPPAVVFLSSFPYRFQLDGTDIQRIGIVEGFKISKLKFDTPFTSLRELGDFREENADIDRLQDAFGKIRIPSTLDGELPSRAFGKGKERVLIGEKFEIPMEDGRIVVGELVQGSVDEHNKKILGIFQVDGVANVICSMPISEDELAAYRESPETFFGVKQDITKIAKEPIELYEFMLASYRNTPKEKLLEWMAGHPGIAHLRELPQNELAKIYCEGCVLSSMAHKK